ncbi:hypothetical protein ACFTWS_05675 [Streptomyces sp. NPDC057027]|uniref:hypothetical protein n=1 Tax=Streptomyces sp. NPDC057027 TaxID=3346004 RepID=UPI00363D8FE2
MGLQEEHRAAVQPVCRVEVEQGGECLGGVGAFQGQAGLRRGVVEGPVTGGGGVGVAVAQPGRLGADRVGGGPGTVQIRTPGPASRSPRAVSTASSVPSGEEPPAGR